MVINEKDKSTRFKSEKKRNSFKDYCKVHRLCCTVQPVVRTSEPGRDTNLSSPATSNPSSEKMFLGTDMLKTSGVFITDINLSLKCSFLIYLYP